MVHDRDLLMDRLSRGVSTSTENSAIFGVPVSEMNAKETKAALLWAIGVIERQTHRLTDFELGPPRRRLPGT